MYTWLCSRREEKARGWVRACALYRRDYIIHIHSADDDDDDYDDTAKKEENSFSIIYIYDKNIWYRRNDILRIIVYVLGL